MPLESVQFTYDAYSNMSFFYRVCRKILLYLHGVWLAEFCFRL